MAGEGARDLRFMRRALVLARRGWGQTAPNPMVGAVIVAGDAIVGEGWHERYGGPHAEVVALDRAGARARGATLYVTLEPCAHYGKTPPCADALIAAGISRVVAAAPEPGPAAGGGASRLRDAGVHIGIGLLEGAARELNAAFYFSNDGNKRPWITLKLALSLDAALADATDGPGWITNPKSRRMAHHLRSGSDAIGVGSGTALADDPLLTVREVPPPRVAPVRVVFDRRLRIPLGARLVLTAAEAPVLVLTGRDDTPAATALRAAGVDVVAVADLAAALAMLHARGVQRLLVEGGAELTGSLLARGLIDRLIIFQAPLILGAGAHNAFTHAPTAGIASAMRMAVVERRALGDDFMTVYALGTP